MDLKTPELKSLSGPTPKSPQWLHLAIWGWACVLLALLQISWGGYQLGMGNQGIQIAFLEKLHDNELFQHDAMVTQTLKSYPSFFFHIVARLLSLTDLSTLYLLLHVAATAGVFAAVIALSNAITRNRWAGIACALFLLAGHHQALAGEALYSTGFTHTWAIFPLSLFALFLFFRDRHIAAFLLAGLIFNFHALEAAHLFAIMGFASLLEIRTLGIKSLASAVGAFIIAALPTILVILSQAMAKHPPTEITFGSDQWLEYMHIRSADHSFPFSWWQGGNTDVPRFLGVLALAALALGFRLPRRMKRKLLFLVAGIGLLFVAGTLFTEIISLPIVIRAQLFRSSRLLYILSLIVIAHACVKGWQLPWYKPATLPRWAAWLEFGSATLTAACLFLPALLPFVPYAVLLALVVALVNGRLAWYEALLAGLALIVALLASQTIDYPLPGIAPLSAANHWLLTKIRWSAMLQNRWPPAYAWIVGAAALTLAWLAALRLRKNTSAMVAACATLAGAVALLALFPVIKAASEPDPAWIEVQNWIKTNTPKTARILTPPTESGFRIFSQRSIVGEWRDGTQLYFKAGFANDWWAAMNLLQPGRVIGADKKSLVNPGVPLDKIDDEKIVDLASNSKAPGAPLTLSDYIVLPKVDINGVMTNTHGMKVVHENAEWIVFEPKFMDFNGAASDAALAEEDAFIRKKVLAAISVNRMSDAHILVVDSGGKPVTGLDFRLTQTNSAFGFGCSLPFFQVPAVDTKADYKPPAVTPAELSHFLEVFNYSVIPFSGQWRFTESQQGKTNYADLDEYVKWCTDHAVRPEFRFLAGYQPSWMKGKVARDQSDFILTRAKDLAQRYGSKITDWQVTSEDVGLKEIGLEEYNEQTRKDRVTKFFTQLRQALPSARLGICDDARFFSPKLPADADADKFRGLDTLKSLQKIGVKVDYVAIEGKHPLGLWASGKSIYDTLDAFDKAGVKIRITEFGIAIGDRIEGTVISEGNWTPQLQAEYYERFFTICFSHPAVEAINVMGIGDTTWRPGQGMLDASGKPTPAFNKLKELITRRWRTNLTNKLPASGPFQYRGYQGTYELALTLPNGKTATTGFNVVPMGPGVDAATANTFKFVLAADGSLKQNP